MNLRDAVERARCGKASLIRCPAHGDRAASLSIQARKPDGWVPLKCFSGCTRGAVLAAGGLGLRDLGPDPETWAPGKPSMLHAAPVPAAEVLPWVERERVEKRKGWPDLETPLEAELAAVSQLRGIPVEGLRLAAERGIFRTVCDSDLGPMFWCVTDRARVVAQKRTFDGSKIAVRDGSPVKAVTLPGSACSWPVGLAGLNPEHAVVLLAEGGPDLLAAFGFIVREGREHDAHAVGMLGASSRVHPTLLPRFDGKTVLVCGQNDTPGRDAAEAWAGQIAPFAKTVAMLELGNAKDLNELLVAGLPNKQQLIPGHERN